MAYKLLDAARERWNKIGLMAHGILHGHLTHGSLLPA
jgi:hypothetical protein